MSLAENIARYYGQGKEDKNGAGWVTCCPIHQENHPSLSVTDNDQGEVDVFCHVGCDFKDIKDRFRADGLLPEWSPDTKKGGKGENKQSPAAEKKEKDQSDAVEKESYIWKKASRDNLQPAVDYFRSRTITIDLLPPCIRWNQYTDKTTNQVVSMVVAAASKPEDTKVHAVQRLFIDTEENKKTGAKMHGECAGRGVWFDRKHNLHEIVVGEGIETTLSAIQATGKNGVAALSTSGMKGLIIPDETEVIYILVDSDPVRDIQSKSMPGQKAAYALAVKFEGSRDGRQAWLVSPDDSCFSDNPEKLDFNDLLRLDPGGEAIRRRIELAERVGMLAWSPPTKPEEDDKQATELLSQEQQMFDRFVFLASDNKIIDTLGHDIKESMMVKDAFQISQAGGWHCYQDENGNDKKMPLAKWWLMSEDKKIAAAIRYYPGKEMLFENGDGRTYFNSFRFPYSRCPVMDIKEREKRLYHWSQIMDTVFHIHREYIEDWLAYTIQQPEKRTQIMPVCMSDQGLGKSLIMAILSRVVGSHNFSNGRIQEVTGLSKTGAKWGDWIFNTKISCIEEMDPEGESGIRFKIYDAMKDIITNETLSLNLKGGKNGTFSVYSSIMGFSNYRDCVKIPFGDRRMYIVDSMERTLLSFEEYKKIWEWMADAKNIVAVFQYLLLREISADFIPGQAKSTPEKVRLQQDGRSIVQSAFDLVIKHYPCDLITSGELQLAVNEAIQYIQGEESEFKNMNADKQYTAIVRSVTSPVAGGKRIRVRREGGQKIEAQVRAIRNITKWVNSDNLRIKEGFLVPIPSKWIVEEKEEEFTKF